KILDEETLVLVAAEELLEFRKVLTLPIECHLDSLGMLDAHCDDAKAFRRTITSVIDDQFYDTLNLSRGALFLRAISRNVLHQDVPDCAIQTRARKRDQSPTVDPMVRKRDKRLVSTAIVPVERPRRVEESGHDVQDALEASGGVVLVRAFLILTRRKECC